MTTRELVLAYIQAIESMDPAALAPFLDPDVEVIEHPNKLNPKGARYDLAALTAAAERGRAIMASQRYDIRSTMTDGDRAIVQLVWTGVLHNGAEMRAQICTVVELRAGKVWRQEQYDCFE